MAGISEFTDRQQEILRAVVGEFVSTGEPVGSKFLVDKCRLEISSATVRKEMSILEQMGLLISPHTSAGRIPTDKAFQVYVNDLISFFEITLTEKTRLEQFYKKARYQLDQLLRTTAHLLAVSSEYSGVVLSPVSTGSIIKRIELVSIIDNLVLLIMISGSGAVHQQKIKVEHSVSQEDLYKISKYINQNIAGYELSDIQEKGIEFVLEKAEGLGHLYEVAVQLTQAFIYNPPHQKVYVDGESNLFRSILENLPERGEELIEGLADHDVVRELISRMKNSNHVTAQFGIELNGEYFTGISVLAKSYSVGGRYMGALGVIGLNRMPYSRLIPALDYSSQILSDVLSEKNDQTDFGVEQHGLQRLEDDFYL